MIIVPVTQSPAVSPRDARELAKRMEQLVRDYQRERPELTEDQIRAALSQSMAESQRPIAEPPPPRRGGRRHGRGRHREGPSRSRPTRVA